MLLRQTVFYLPAQLLGPLSQFIAAIVWTHLLTLDDYGHLFIILSAQELVSLLFLSWWTHYTMRYGGAINDEAARGRFQASENSLLIVTALAQLLGTIIIVRGFVSGASTGLVVAAIVYTVTRSVLTHLAERARSAGDIASYTLAQTVGPLAGMLLGFLLMRLFDYGPQEALSGYAAAQIAALLVVWHRMRLGMKTTLPDQSLLRSALRYGLPLLGAGAFGWVSMNGIRLVVESFSGAAAVGLLSVGWGLGQRAVAVVAMLVTAASYPLALKYMHAGSREKSFEQVSLNGALILGVLAPAAVGIFMVGYTFIDLVVAAEFRDMAVAILPIAVGAAVLRNSRVHFLDQMLLLAERPGELLAVNIGEALATMLFCVVGLKLYGLPGAALGCVPGALIGWLHCYILTRRHGLRLPLAHFVRIGVATLIMFAALFLFPATSSVASLVLEIGIGIIVYALAIGLLYVGEIRGFRREALSPPSAP